MYRRPGASMLKETSYYNTGEHVKGQASSVNDNPRTGHQAQTYAVPRRYLEEACDARPDGGDIWVERVYPQQDPDTPSYCRKADHVGDEQPQPAPRRTEPLRQQAQPAANYWRGLPCLYMGGPPCRQASHLDLQKTPSSNGSYSCSSSLHANLPDEQSHQPDCAYKHHEPDRHFAAVHACTAADKQQQPSPPDAVDHDEGEGSDQPRQVLQERHLGVAGCTSIYPEPPGAWCNQRKQLDSPLARKPLHGSCNALASAC